MIYGDFKVTINPQILVGQYPILTIEELLAGLNNEQKFTKLVSSDAYLHMKLEEQSKNLVVINTPLVLLRYNHMPIGISMHLKIFKESLIK